ncbi:hypothetical protein, partial [Escherichia coli]|uniref:hypothetical protein n=1 Tax=Escherichia coli TaxID=562 RepID=UPI001BAF18B6
CWRRCAGVIFFAIRFLTFANKGRACRMAWFTTAGNAPSPDAYLLSTFQGVLHFAAYASLKVCFPFRVKRIRIHLDGFVSYYPCI